MANQTQTQDEVLNNQLAGKVVPQKGINKTAKQELQLAIKALKESNVLIVGMILGDTKGLLPTDRKEVPGLPEGMIVMVLDGKVNLHIYLNVLLSDKYTNVAENFFEVHENGLRTVRKDCLYKTADGHHYNLTQDAYWNPRDSDSYAKINESIDAVISDMA